MKILTTPDPHLRHKAKKIKTITKKTHAEIKKMLELLKAARDPEGVGLAATQVGLDKRIFILLLEDGPRVFINPVVTKSSKKMITDVIKKESKRWIEGCLSMPRIWGFVDRPYSVTLKYQTFDIDSRMPKLTTETKTFENIQSSYVQHERDHLDGILFTDHILKQKGIILEETEDGLQPIKVLPPSKNGS